MRNYCAALVCILLTLVTSAAAFEERESNSGDSLAAAEKKEDHNCNSSNVQVELLFFRPTVDQSAYVISSSNNVFGEDLHPRGRRHLNDTSYKPGFRVEATYVLNYRFTRFAAGYSDSVTGPFLFDTIGFPGNGSQAPEDSAYSGTAHIKDQYTYYASDLTYSRLAFDSRADCFELLFGLHFAYIQYESHFRATGTFVDDGVLTAVRNRLSRNSHFWGIGPQLGMKYHYYLSDLSHCLHGLSLNGQARGALLCSKTNTRFAYTTARTGSSGVNLHNNSIWRVTPSVDARLSLSYDFHLNSLKGALEIGYEWLWYNKSVNSIVGYDVAFVGDSLDSYSDLSLQAPFLALAFDF
jgi:hypothetical protein